MMKLKEQKEASKAKSIAKQAEEARFQAERRGGSQVMADEQKGRRQGSRQQKRSLGKRQKPNRSGLFQWQRRARRSLAKRQKIAAKRMSPE